MYPSPNRWASPRGAFGLVVFVLCLVGLFLVYRAGDDTNPPRGDDTNPPRGKERVTNGGPAARSVTVAVDRVVDGDTARVFYLGESVYVRYIGIDTPESVDPGSPVECFSEEAKEFNAGLIEGEDVRMVFGPERLDRFDRLLAYVYVRDLMVNAELLRRGYAETLTIPPNDARSGRFDRLEGQARKADLGRWGACS